MVFLWSTNKSAPLASYTDHTEDVTHVDFTDNLNYVVSASLDRTFRIWNIENGSLIRILFFDYPITA
jgi:WD40 repeat protein